MRSTAASSLPLSRRPKTKQKKRSVDFIHSKSINSKEAFMLRMIIEGVGFDHLKQTVVVLKDWEGSKLLPTWIGPNEAKAIALELEGARPSRPLSHDLLLQAIALAQGKVTRIVINDLQDATFFATIDI